MPLKTHWAQAPDCPELASDDAHAWAVPLIASQFAWEELLSTLSSDERNRAQEFRIEDLKRRFVIARCALRKLLSRYLGVQPTTIEFAIDSNGKPRLAGKHTGAGLHFNLSHSAELALIAVAANCEVGIDVERRRDVGHLEQIATRFFHPSEADGVLNAAAAARSAAFLRNWTAKEAVLKAFGIGIRGSLADFKIPQYEFSQGWIELPSQHGREESSRCWLEYITPCDGYVGAIACVESERRVRCWTFSF